MNKTYPHCKHKQKFPICQICYNDCNFEELFGNVKYYAYVCKMRISDLYEFNDYYCLVIDNISKRLLTDDLKERTNEELLEVINEMYYKDIPPTTAVVLLESFYSNFRKYFNKNLQDD